MNYRHGDLALISIKELPKGFKVSTSKVLMRGSNNNPHSFDNGKFYPITPEGCIFGYLVADNTTLFHPEHGKIAEEKKLREAKIKNGIYELRSQVEDTNEGMKGVVD